MSEGCAPTGTRGANCRTLRQAQDGQEDPTQVLLAYPLQGRRGFLQKLPGVSEILKTESGQGSTYSTTCGDRTFQARGIVGPLPRTKSGNRYILVMCVYATRYPEAVPIKAVDAEEELVRIFAQVGIPEEMLTDQGSNLIHSCCQKSTSYYMYTQ